MAQLKREGGNSPPLFHSSEQLLNTGELRGELTGTLEQLAIGVQDEPSVVAHNDDTTLVVVDGLDQRINRLDIQIIGRLVQNQDIGGAHSQLGEDNTRLLPSYEGRTRFGKNGKCGVQWKCYWCWIIHIMMQRYFHGRQRTDWNSSDNIQLGGFPMDALS